jgi:hypothetical protein
MDKAFVVRYRARPEAAEENQRLIEAVFAELAVVRPAGLSYRVYRLADGVTFVHVAVGDGDALGRLTAFRQFQQGGDTRREQPPEASPAAVVGSYAG